MITSAADRPSSGWISTGIPRPLSVTVTDSSAWMVTVMRSQWPARDSSMALSTTSKHHVVQAGAIIGVADVHPGSFAHCIKTL